MTKQPSLVLLAGAVGFFFLSPLFVTNKAYAAVVINEIAPKYSDATWEWVELYNTGSESVSLDRWKLDHTAGDGKSFILNASFIIQPHGFLTLVGSQTAISFSIQGDTVRLFDANGTLVDSQSYWGTLGYNTAMGRSTDGGDGWVICAPDPYTGTPDKPNNCPPAPTATPIPTPTNTPTPTPRMSTTATPTPAGREPLSGGASPTPARQTFGAFVSSPPEGNAEVLGTDVQPPQESPSVDVLTFRISKTWIAYVLLGIAAMAILAMLALWLRRRSMREKKFSEHE